MRTTLVTQFSVLPSSTHQHWLDMMANCSVSEEFSLANTEQENLCSISPEEARQEVEAQAKHNDTAASRPAWVNSWSYVDEESSASGLQSLLLSTTIIISCLAIMSS